MYTVVHAFRHCVFLCRSTIKQEMSALLPVQLTEDIHMDSNVSLFLVLGNRVCHILVSIAITISYYRHVHVLHAQT